MKTRIAATLLAIGMILYGSVEIRADEIARPANPRRETLRQSEYKFVPTRLDLKVGEPVELTIVNDGTMVHEFVTDALKDLPVRVEIGGAVVEARGFSELENPPGQTVMLRFTPEKPGQFAYTCQAEKPQSHLRVGMSGMMVFQ
jgi:plastocyanin